MDETDAPIILDRVTKRFGSLTAVDSLSLRIPRGQIVALLGPNGAGKSTTVSLLMGLAAPDGGEVSVCGERPGAAVSRGRVAAMLQDCGPMPGVRVAELVELTRRMYPAPSPTAAAIEVAGLADMAQRRVDRLSGGQLQRLKFALVAVADPELMLLDEPTVAMDVQARAGFWSAMRTYAAAGTTILFASHYLDEVERNADRVVVMAHGRVVADGTPDEVRAAGGAAIVRFRLPQPAALPRLPGRVTFADGWARVDTADPDLTVRMLAASDVPWRDLRVYQTSLDESFLALVGTDGADGTAKEMAS
ncbi:MAG: hypothetical protein BGO26_13610 [Actinobacteria bacterium 69-20]|nr:ABC transporter ATP-binding protein [Actinomycetota bacterium]OJV27622.1 MAG: hypothetical protein BGO26_13610 [Actinobacteria bacterium 69-20]